MIIVWVVVSILVGAVGVKWMHNDTKHVPQCSEKKPDCKCETLEAGKVIVK